MKTWIFVFLEIPGGLSAPALSPHGGTWRARSRFAHAHRWESGLLSSVCWACLPGILSLPVGLVCPFLSLSLR